ncbi:ATP-binding protein [Cupriavidus sp. 30B13]|uniref:ATP-binding protein n=1 Tax=Cupriavidus sp. 30B13 TaxID=3384241 RepID=UPI003B90B74A
MIESERSKRMIAWPYWHWAIAIGGCVIVVLLWVASGWDVWRARRSVLADNDRELSSLASALAEQAARTLQGVEFILRRTSVWYLDPRHTGMAPEEATAFLRQQIDGVPQVRSLTIADAAGRRVATSLQPATGDVSLSGRQYFQDLQRAAPGTVVVGEPIRGMADGRPTFVVAGRLQDEYGRFRGVALASIQIEYFRHFYEEIDLGPGTGIRLLSKAGAPLVVFADRSGRPAPTPVRVAAHPVPGFALAIEVSRDESVVLAVWRETSVIALVRTGLISLFIGLLAYALSRQVRRLQTVNEQLRASEQRWRAVFENAPLGITVQRLHGPYLASNPAFQRMIGYTPAELAGLRAEDVTHPDDAADTRRRVEALFREDAGSVRFQKRYLHRNGTVVWADLSIARVPASPEASASAPQPSLDLIVATVEDVTQRREAEENRRRLEGQLRQAQKLEALGTFAGGIAHDFNNILAAILGYGEQALGSPGIGAAQRRHVEQIMRAGERARSLVNRILTFSRSGMTLRVPVPLLPVVTETIELFKASLPARIALDVRIHAPDLVVSGDATHVHQILMNLCSNAVHAMPDGGTLRVSLGAERFDRPVALSHGTVEAGEVACLSVADSGTGIAPEILERIFNPFFTTRGTGEGTGLGLSLVDGIVREYGGGVDVHSVVGKGTRFDVYLPVADALPAPDQGAGADAPCGDGQTVLLVDDEQALVALGEEVLAELGYEPVGFHSSLAAWEAFEADPERFDVVLTDQTMPGLTGIELALRIRGLRPALPVLLCSGYGNAALESEARAAGIRALLRKPLRKSDLAAVLAQAAPASPAASPRDAS